MRKLIPVAIASLLLIALAFAQTTRVGPLPSADSLAINQRVGRTGETITQPAGGGNKERVRRGNCYYVTASGVTPGTAIGTTAAFVLYNPQSSGNLLVLRKTWVAYQSGTLGLGVLYHCANATTTQAAPSGGTLQTNVPALIGNNNASVGVARINATVVTPVAVAQFAPLPGGFTTTSITSLAPCTDDLDDGIQLLPGTSYQMQAAAAAGTSPLIQVSVLWEEQPLLNGQP